MMPKRNFGKSGLFCVTIQNTPPKSRAPTAVRFAFRHHFSHQRVGILFQNGKRHAFRAKIVGQHVLGEPRLLLIQIDSHQLEIDWGSRLQVPQQREHGIGVFPARQTHHNAVTRLNHVEIGNGLAHLAA